MPAYLHIPKNKCTIIPLGAEVFSKKVHSNNEFNLIYVGSLNNRDIDKTIIWLKYFVDKYPNVEITYKIIGFGSKVVEDKLQALINDLNLSKIVKFIGIVPYKELYRYIEKSNIGVSFVPITPYFDVQPPTKTIEYLMSGLPVIATATRENIKLINENNGVLINDDVNNFFYGLRKLYRKQYDNQFIRREMGKYKWQNIVNSKVRPLIQNIINEGI